MKRSLSVHRAAFLRLAPAAAVCAVVMLVFGGIVTHDWVEFDDTIHVTENPSFFPVSWQGLAGFWALPYRNLYVPMSYMLYAGECVATRWLYGDGPTAALRPVLFHVVSVVLHALCTLLVLRLLRRYTTRPWIAAAGAIVFAIHPLQVESVAWIAEQRGLLAGLLSLTAIDRFLYWLDREGGSKLVQPSYVLATVAFGLALLSKPTAVVTPLLALAIAVGGGKASWAAVARPLAPWAVLAATAAVITRLVQPPELTWFHVPFAARPLVAADAIAFYAAKILAPVDLCVAYGRSPRVALVDPRAPLAALMVALGLLAVMLLPRCRQWRLPVSLFLIPLVPVLGLTDFGFQNQSTVADRYAYLAMLGPALAVVRAGELLEAFQRPRALWRIAAGAWIIVMGMTSFYQTATWRNTCTLAECACHVTPGDTGAWTMLAGHYLATGDSERALACAHRALDIAPKNGLALLNVFGAAVRLGRSAEIATTSARLRGLGYTDEDLVEAFYDRGVSHLKADRATEAAIDFGIALDHDPKHPWVATNLGVALTRLGRIDAAVAVLRESLDQNPVNAAAWVGLGNALLEQGAAEEAVAAYGRAIELEPDDAATLANRAWARLASGDRAGAARDAEAVTVLGHPIDPDLRAAVGKFGAPPVPP
jgi:tetratricopeptide (TPR) repeat protein